MNRCTPSIAVMHNSLAVSPAPVGQALFTGRARIPALAFALQQLPRETSRRAAPGGNATRDASQRRHEKNSPWASPVAPAMDADLRRGQSGGMTGVEHTDRIQDLVVTAGKAGTRWIRLGGHMTRLSSRQSSAIGIGFIDVLSREQLGDRVRKVCWAAETMGRVSSKRGYVQQAKYHAARTNPHEIVSGRLLAARRNRQQPARLRSSGTSGVYGSAGGREDFSLWKRKRTEQ